MTFLLKNPTECNLYLVREFYANWDPREWDSKVKIIGQVVTFMDKDLNVILDATEVDSEPLK